MISVCMATYNGENFIKEQINSILPQLDSNDELLISDDGSTDQTISLINSYKDDRIKIINGPQKGLIKNFENAIKNSRGEIIFLADQDDVWMPDKVNKMSNHFKNYDLVVSDCRVTDNNLNQIHESFFVLRGSSSGLTKNLIKNSYLGCCIAFRRKLLKKALPFPENIPMHDWWLGLVAEAYYNSCFIKEPLLLYRRHGNNNSPASEKSKTGVMKMIHWRITLFVNIVLLRIKPKC